MAREPWRPLRGAAIPLLLPDLDTDVITPMRRVLEGGDALTRYAFEPLRYRSDGSPDPDFALNQEPYREAPILLAGANFGCGSSRETAVWALVGLGIRSVIAPSFGDIFFANCFKNGVLPIRLPESDLESLASEARSLGGEAPEFQIDLERSTLTTPSGRRLGFQVQSFRRRGLLEGLDDIELTLERIDEVAAFQAHDRRSRPWVYWPGSAAAMSEARSGVTAEPRKRR